MKNHIYILLVMLSFCSCEDFVDVGLPDSQLTGVTVFEDPNTANAAMVHIYTKLRDTGFLTGSGPGSSIGMGLYADELQSFNGTGTPALELYNNSLLPSNSVVTQMWNESYYQIYCANAVIAGVEQSQALESADRDQFKGEALFVRALIHFYLVNTYGDVPYITTTGFEQNRLVSRLPEDEVYARIMADLEAAVSLLPDNYSSDERVRPNKGAAYALLARACLYKNLWAEAADAASAVINNPLYVWETSLENVFLKVSTSTIWQLKPLQEGDNTYEGQSFIFLEGPPPALALSQQLVDSFEPGDLRQSHWIGTVTNGSDTWYYPYKYKENANTGASVEYSVLFRLAEQYLIRAEARARQGDLIGAKEDLNRVRSRAGLPDSGAVTADGIITAILEERRHELFTEHGHRFYDLKRTGQLDAALPPVKPGWQPFDILWPIPESEMLANPNLSPQNTGY